MHLEEIHPSQSSPAKQKVLTVPTEAIAKAFPTAGEHTRRNGGAHVTKLTCALSHDGWFTAVDVPPDDYKSNRIIIKIPGSRESGTWVGRPQDPTPSLELMPP